MAGYDRAITDFVGTAQNLGSRSTCTVVLRDKSVRCHADQSPFGSSSLRRVLSGRSQSPQPGIGRRNSAGNALDRRVLQPRSTNPVGRVALGVKWNRFGGSTF